MRSMRLSQGSRAAGRRRLFAPAARVAGAVVGPALLALLAAIPARAEQLAAEDAAKHIGETATVCGVVAGGKYNAASHAQPTFLDFGKPYPDQVFTAVIFGSDRSKFGTPETTLRGRRICVTGKLQDRGGLPEIILTDPKQLSQ